MPHCARTWPRTWPMGRQRLERTGQVCRTHDRCDARGDSAHRAAFWLLPDVRFFHGGGRARPPIPVQFGWPTRDRFMGGYFDATNEMVLSGPVRRNATHASSRCGVNLTNNAPGSGHILKRSLLPQSCDVSHPPVRSPWAKDSGQSLPGVRGRRGVHERRLRARARRLQNDPHRQRQPID